MIAVDCRQRIAYMLEHTSLQSADKYSKSERFLRDLYIMCLSERMYNYV